MCLNFNLLDRMRIIFCAHNRHYDVDQIVHVLTENIRRVFPYQVFEGNEKVADIVVMFDVTLTMSHESEFDIAYKSPRHSFLIASLLRIV